MEWHVIEGGDGKDDARVADNVGVEKKDVFGSICIRGRIFGFGGTIEETFWSAILLLYCCCLFASPCVG